MKSPVGPVRNAETSAAATIFDRLGTPSAVNGKGVYTDLGGAYLSEGVWAAMTEANRHCVEMVPLLESSGRRIAELVGLESAWVVPGASAAIALATAACLTRGDGPAIERLPDVTGLPAEVVIQSAHRYKYLRMAWYTGAKIRYAGSDSGTTRAELEAALDPSKVSMFFFVGHLDGRNGTLPLAEAAAIARSRGIPTFVDAAFLNYPPSTMRRFTDQGADLVCFSAKYWYGPNGGGFLGGRPDLIRTVSQVDFTRFESGPVLRFGRAFKLDRFTLVGTVVALEEWFSMDHEARWAGYRRAVETIADAVRGVPGVVAEPLFFTMEETLERESPPNCVRVSFDGNRFTRSAGDVHRALWEGNPRIVVHLVDDTLILAVDAMAPGAEELVARRLKEAVSS
jgi:L-seryl-tRNA(Ser) seleniumtransferase